MSDELYGGTAHDEYPERAYIPRTDFPGGLETVSGGGTYRFLHKYRLPAGLSGDLVLLQW